MSWATIGTLTQVDQEQNSATPFSIPAGGSNPLHPGNAILEPIFYREDIQKLMGQAPDIAGVRLINTYLSTRDGGANNPIALTFLVACKENNGDFVNLNGANDIVAITCPPVYMESATLGSPQPGTELSIDMIKKIKSNGYQ